MRMAHKHTKINALLHDHKGIIVLQKLLVYKY